MKENIKTDEQQKWDQVLVRLEETLMRPTYDTMVRPLRLISADEDKGELVLSTDKPATIAILYNRYLDVMKQAAAKVYGRNVDIVIESSENSTARDNTEYDHPAAADPIPRQSSGSQLNPHYTFDTYVVGGNNELAYAACLAAARGPASTSSNPLFIYGSSGLGKTHLITAIGNYILKNDPGRNFLYLSSEKFTNELVKALQNHQMDGFRDKYRNIDILMIDDIQFIEKKDSTQEELFHTFNELYEGNKQIVFTSDRPPKDISTIDQRLKSRFEWGLSVDIQPPDFETRVAILKNKVKMDHLDISDEIIYVIAENITTNIRELEGALNIINANSKLPGKTVTKESAEEILRHFFHIKKRMIDIPLIKNTVCAYYNINVQDMDSSKRKKDIAHPRQIAMYLCRDLTDTSLPKIGKDFGNRDHTTVMHAINKINEELKTDEKLSRQIDELRSSITDNA